MTTMFRYRYDNFSIRPAVPEDVPSILSLVRARADYEQATGGKVVTEEQLDKWIFREHRAEVLIGEADGDAVGFALFFESFSTLLGGPALYIEDMFVIPKAQGNGYGKMLLQYLSRLTLERGYGRLEWTCLNWDRPSIDFYLYLGAERMDEWTVYRLSGEALEELALEEPAEEE